MKPLFNNLDMFRTTITFLIRALTVTLLISTGLGSAARAADVRRQIDANVMTELSFDAKADHDDPFNTVSLDVVFTDPQGQEMRVPAFWAGGSAWKARYASPVVGPHRFRSECSDTQDQGLHGVTGEVQITAYVGKNPLYLHGPIRVAANRRYLEHADGTPFFWLADTWWMGLCHRMHWPDEFKTLTADRKEKGFNVIQIVAGLYPDMHPFDPRGANEAGYPWEAEYSRIRPAYFDAADQRLEYLVDQGFSPCIVGAWGYFMPWMGVDKAKQHWRYLIARYGALPVVWSAAGEANLPWYLAKGFPYDDRKQVTEWTEVMRYIRATDPYHRPLTIHPTGIGRLSARHATDDVALLDIDMLQTPHGQRDAVDPTVRTMQESYADKPTLPVINGEAAYEMLGDNLPTKWTRQMFWLCLTNGAAGHTYGANGIWQCNRPGEPHGPSPHHNGGVGYGKIPWNESMNLPGSRQVGLGKKLFEGYAWQNFTPHPEWATYAADDATQPPAWGQWIWFPEGEPAIGAPVAQRFFRKTFELPAGKKPPHATLWISADDRFTAYVNGELIREHAGTGTFQSIDISSKLKPGRNVIAIVAENLPAPVAANPAGLLASLHVQAADGTQLDIQSDNSWLCAKADSNDRAWTLPKFDDRSWASAKELGKYGCSPWGTFQSTATYGPFATGIPDKVRIVYVPESRPVQMQQLEPNAEYRAFAFDPTSGEKSDLAAVNSSKQLSTKINKPERITSDDWVVVVERVE